MSSGPGSTGYDERLWPGPLGWALVVGFAVLVGVAVWPVRPTAAALAGILTLAGATVAAVRTSPRIQVVDGELRAARAHIEIGWLGQGRVLDRPGVRAALGPGSDARAFVVLRSWLPGAVEVEVVDPQDPTPSWLLSSRHPGLLLAAIEAARPGPLGQAAHSEQIG
ncbi:MAG TPA: DUF3093 domain-containing protein [Actinotalea sp.]|nr:DUF3093 domain-containing protein [Actinotalea sp.]